LIVAQAGLGAITVFENNSPVSVTAHLLLGAVFFAVLIVICGQIVGPVARFPSALGSLMRTGHAKFLYSSPTRTGTPSAHHPQSVRKLNLYRNHVYIALLLVFVQIGLGGMVSASHAGLVCPDFPTCNGAWIPPMEGPVGLQMIHRFMAYAVVLVVVGTFFVGRKALAAPTDRRVLKFALATVIVQLLLGVGLIHAKIPMPMSVAHLGLAMLLFGLLTRLAYGTRRA
jgi:cytochrome c oxidase assembly protein subunit 15